MFKPTKPREQPKLVPLHCTFTLRIWSDLALAMAASALDILKYETTPQGEDEGVFTAPQIAHDGSDFVKRKSGEWAKSASEFVFATILQ